LDTTVKELVEDMGSTLHGPHVVLVRVLYLSKK
jgi:hypothetical protein